MNRRPKILDILRESREVAADKALAAGVDQVEPCFQAEIVEMLLRRAKAPGLAALPELFDKLHPAAQRNIITGASALFGALRTTIRSPETQTRLNSLEIIRQSGNMRLAYLATLALHDGAAKVRADGAATLRHLTTQYAANHADTAAALNEAGATDPALTPSIVNTLKMLGEERQFLLAALRDAVDNYESHHRPEVLEAAMSFTDDLESSLFQSSTIKRGKLTHAMVDILASTLSPRLVPFVYVALCYPELRRRVTTLLANHRDQAFFVELIRCHWLARDPAIRRNLASVRSVSWLGDGFEPAFTLPADVAAMAPGWLILLGLPSDQKISILLNFLLIDNQAANRAAIWAMVNINTPASSFALQSVLDHDDPVVRQMAEREVAHRSRRQQFAFRPPRKGRPQAWSYLLDSADLNEDFDDLWQHFDRLQPVQARSAGHHAIEFIPGFSTQLKNKLLDSNPAERARALRFIMALHVTGRFGQDIFNMANDPDPGVRATTLKALVQIGDATSRRILERGLGDECTLVQAAAIEGLDHTGAIKRIDLIEPKTTSDDAHVRAAAIRALLRMKQPQAASALLAMMNDLRAEHRCCALWVVDQLRLTGMAQRVFEMSGNDADARICRIAQQVAKRLNRIHLTDAHPPAQAAKPVLVEAAAP